MNLLNRKVLLIGGILNLLLGLYLIFPSVAQHKDITSSLYSIVIGIWALYLFRKKSKHKPKKGSINHDKLLD